MYSETFGKGCPSSVNQHRRQFTEVLWGLVASWDFLVAVIVVLLCAWVLPSRLPSCTAEAIALASVSMLSIIFSVFFAGLAVLLSSSDSFVLFLEEEGDYSHLLTIYQLTLASLFLALVVSLALFVLCQFSSQYIRSVWFSLYLGIVFYSLFATMGSVQDSIRFARSRAEYLLVSAIEAQDEGSGTSDEVDKGPAK